MSFASHLMSFTHCLFNNPSLELISLEISAESNPNKQAHLLFRQEYLKKPTFYSIEGLHSVG